VNPNQGSLASPRIAQQDLNEICLRTEALWEEVRGQHLFLSGGTGFFGCWLLESFADANRRFDLKARITVLTRSPDAFRIRCPHLADDPAIDLAEGDVRSFVFPAGTFPFVIHAAADTGRTSTEDRRSAALNTLLTTVDGTRRMLEFAASHGSRKFLMISSGAVYGVQPSHVERLDESYTGGPDTCLPASAYGEGKRAAEALCAAFATPGFECKIARCFAFVGGHLPLDGSYAIGNFIRSVLRSEAIVIHGDGQPLRSYLYATDLVVWLWTVLLRGTSLRPVNVGSDHAISIRDLAAEVKQALDSQVEVTILGDPGHAAPPIHYVPAVQRAKELGLEQTVQLREAIQRTAAWYGWTKSEGAIS
jgi:nucleoside-diphosphate-sugar epimerase